MPETEELIKCGILLNKTGATFIVRGEINERGNALDEGTIVCLQNRYVIGRVEEVCVLPNLSWSIVFVCSIFFVGLKK